MISQDNINPSFITKQKNWRTYNIQKPFFIISIGRIEKLAGRLFSITLIRFIYLQETIYLTLFSKLKNTGRELFTIPLFYNSLSKTKKSGE